MFNPVDRFRVDLANAVRRLSRKTQFETSVEEMVSHFDALYQEELKTEADGSKAEKNARKRMGSIYKIAFQIVNSPDRTRKGMMTQALMFTIFALVIPIFICMTMGLTWSYFRNDNLIRNTIIVLLFGGGLVAGIGISIAKRIAWKPLVITTLISVVATGVMSNRLFYSEPHLTKQEMTDLVGKQAALEPKVAKIEAQVGKIIKLRGQSPEEWKKELRALPALVKEEHIPFYKEDLGTSGGYLYPSDIKYRIDYAITYSMTLSRTEDLALAQNAWNKYMATYEDRFADFRSREDCYKLWRDDLAIFPVLWIKGFRFSGGVCLRLGVVFSLFTLLGYLLGTVRVYGFDWLRLSRS